MIDEYTSFVENLEVKLKIQEMFNVLEKEHKELKLEHQRVKKNLEKQLVKSEEKLEVFKEKIKSQQEDVVKPLIEQVKVREQKLVEVRKDNESLAEQNKKLYAIVRSPKLSQMF